MICHNFQDCSKAHNKHFHTVHLSAIKQYKVKYGILSYYERITAKLLYEVDNQISGFRLTKSDIKHSNIFSLCSLLLLWPHIFHKHILHNTCTNFHTVVVTWNLCEVFHLITLGCSNEYSFFFPLVKAIVSLVLWSLDLTSCATTTETKGTLLQICFLSTFFIKKVNLSF